MGSLFGVLLFIGFLAAIVYFSLRDSDTATGTENPYTKSKYAQVFYEENQLEAEFHRGARRGYFGSPNQLHTLGVLGMDLDPFVEKYRHQGLETGLALYQRYIHNTRNRFAGWDEWAYMAAAARLLKPHADQGDIEALKALVAIYTADIDQELPTVFGGQTVVALKYTERALRLEESTYFREKHIRCLEWVLREYSRKKHQKRAAAEASYFDLPQTLDERIQRTAQFAAAEAVKYFTLEAEKLNPGNSQGELWYRIASIYDEEEFSSVDGFASNAKALEYYLKAQECGYQSAASRVGALQRKLAPNERDIEQA